MPERGGLVGRLLQEVETRSGVTMVANDRLSLLEQAFVDLRATYRELDLLGYEVLDYMSGNPAELRPESRRAMAKKSLIAWMNDPQAFRAIETLVDFVLGRGVPQPRAKDEDVQDRLDDFWNDPDNKILISTPEGQRRVVRDLLIQANVFPLIFDDGADAKVKVGLLSHDAVERVRRDDENRLRILYYLAREQQQVWNNDTDRYETPPGARPKLLYYAHWANIRALEDEGVDFNPPPKEKLGSGSVYHLCVWATTEMAFGVPMMQRTMRWFAAYNDFMAARVDMMKAAAAFIMKRKIKGTPNQLAKLATKAISRQSPLALGSLDTPDMPMAGRAAAILNENDMVDHESLKLDTGAGNAQQDAGMLHGQISAGTGLPKHYLGEADANLALATAMELPVIKEVESLQQVVEGFYRALFERVIERSVEGGFLDETVPGKPVPSEETVDDAYMRLAAARMVEAGLIEEAEVETAVGVMREVERIVREAHEEEVSDEAETQRDLSYEFSMPSPLRRMMTDLVTAIQVIAQTFDPNNTNVELSRTLLTVALAEALEIDDPADAVERILPPGYVDPMLAMAAAQSQAPPEAPGGQGAPGEGGQGRGGGAAAGAAQRAGERTPPAGAGSRYGGRMQSQAPEDVRGSQEAVLTLRGRGGQVVRTVPLRLSETRVEEDEALFATVGGRVSSIDALFDSDIGRVAMAELDALALGTANGDHSKEDG